MAVRLEKPCFTLLAHGLRNERSLPPMKTSHLILAMILIVLMQRGLSSDGAGLGPLSRLFDHMAPVGFIYGNE